MNASMDLDAVATHLGISREGLVELSCQDNIRRYRKHFSGAHRKKGRVTFEPSDVLRRVSVGILSDLRQRAKVHHLSKGYVRGESCRKNAELHVGKRCVWKIDLRHAFESVTIYQVEKALRPYYQQEVAKVLAGCVCLDGHLVLGNPAAPYIFNLHNKRLMKKLNVYAKVFDLSFSAYSDDFYFSGDEIPRAFHALAHAAIRHYGYRPHKFESNKNRVMVQGKDTVIVTGLRVTMTETRLPRSKVFEAKRLVTQLLAGQTPTERVWIPLWDEEGYGGYWDHQLPRRTESTIGFLRYCFSEDLSLRHWVQRRMCNPRSKALLRGVFGGRLLEKFTV